MGEKEGDMMPERIFPYGDNHFTLNELLEKPEVLSYSRRNGVEKDRKALRKKLYKGLCGGSINEEAVTEYSQRPRPVPAPRTKLIPAPRTRPVPIPRKIMSKLRPTPPPRKRKEKPVPPPRTRNVKPVPPRRTRNVRPVPPPKECEHGTTEEIDGIIFCILCGLEIDHNPLREGLVRERECQAFHVPSRKNPIFKRRTGPKKPKKEYIPVSPSEVSLLVKKEKNEGKEIKDQILGYLGLLDEN